MNVLRGKFLSFYFNKTISIKYSFILIEYKKNGLFYHCLYLTCYAIFNIEIDILLNLHNMPLLKSPTPCDDHDCCDDR